MACSLFLSLSLTRSKFHLREDAQVGGGKNPRRRKRKGKEEEEEEVPVATVERLDSSSASLSWPNCRRCWQREIQKGSAQTTTKSKGIAGTARAREWHLKSFVLRDVMRGWSAGTIEEGPRERPSREFRGVGGPWKTRTGWST